MMNPVETLKHIDVLEKLNDSVEPDLCAVADHLRHIAHEHRAACVREGQLHMAIECPVKGSYALQRDVHMHRAEIERGKALSLALHREVSRLLGVVFKRPDVDHTVISAEAPSFAGVDALGEYLNTPDEGKAAKLEKLLSEGLAVRIVPAVPA